jgi:hypothetical protein
MNRDIPGDVFHVMNFGIEGQVEVHMGEMKTERHSRVRIPDSLL